MAVSPSALEDAWGNGGDELMTDEHHPIIDPLARTIGAV